MNIRKIALAAFITTVLGLLMPFWNASQAAERLVSMHPLWKWWTIPALVLVVMFSAIMPVFYFALYRNQELLGFSKHLRFMSLISALTVAAFTAIGLPRGTWNISQVSVLLGVPSNLSYVLLLIAIFQHSSGESSSISPQGPFLVAATKVAVITWGIVVVLCCIHLTILTPYSYFQIRTYMLQIGRQPPELRDMMAQSLRTLIQQACLFTAPFVIYKSALRQ